MINTQYMLVYELFFKNNLYIKSVCAFCKKFKLHPGHLKIFSSCGWRTFMNMLQYVSKSQEITCEPFGLVMQKNIDTIDTCVILSPVPTCEPNGLRTVRTRHAVNEFSTNLRWIRDTWRTQFILFSRKKLTNFGSWQVVCEPFADGAAHACSPIHTYDHLVRMFVPAFRSIDIKIDVFDSIV